MLTMSWPLILLLTLYQLHIVVNAETAGTPAFNLNALTNNEEERNGLIPPEVENVINTNDESAENNIIPFVSTGFEQTEVEFRHPISAVNIDYSKNVIVLKFRKQRPQLRVQIDPEEEEKRRSLESNFMRLGRSPVDFMRLGKRQAEEFPLANSNDRSKYNTKESSGRYGRSQEGIRDSRGDNFMRFGRSSQDFMRFGRAAADFMRLGRNPSDFMRFGRSADNFMRFGKSPDFMRFGRAGADSFMRLGRSPEDFMRFGRTPKDDFMRFGRTPNEDFMRFGRTPKDDFMRFGRALKMQRSPNQNFMRFGRLDNFMRFGRTPTDTSNEMANFMRFGKSLDHLEKENKTKPLLQKDDVKNAAKLLHQNEKDNDEGESNPVDKAIKVLFDKHQQQQEQLQKNHFDDNDSLGADEMSGDYDLSMAN